MRQHGQQAVAQQAAAVVDAGPCPVRAAVVPGACPETRRVVLRAAGSVTETGEHQAASAGGWVLRSALSGTACMRKEGDRTRGGVPARLLVTNHTAALPTTDQPRMTPKCSLPVCA